MGTLSVNTLQTYDGTNSVLVEDLANLAQGSVSGATNTGTGSGIFKDKTGANLNFKTLKAGSNVTITDSGANEVLISSSGSGSSPVVNKRIVVMGDSMAAQQGILGSAWPDQLERNLRGRGERVDVYNLAMDGYTFNKANTIASFNGKSMLQRTIDLVPDVVIVAFGINDAVINVESRSAAQIQADAAFTISTLATSLPAAKIIYASEKWFDDSFRTPASNWLNKDVAPYFMQKRSGILTDTYNSEMLGDTPPASLNTGYSRWSTNIDAPLKANASIAGWFEMPWWKAWRLGLGGADVLHMTNEGNVFFAGAATLAFINLPALQAVFPSLRRDVFDLFDNPQFIFGQVLSVVGSGTSREYQAAPWLTIAEHPSQFWGPWRAINPDAWYLPSKTVASGSNTSAGEFVWRIKGAANSLVQVSVDGGAFVNTGEFTDSNGTAQGFGVASAAVGLRVLRFKVAQDVTGPFNIQINSTATSKGFCKAIGGSGIVSGVVNDYTQVPFVVANTINGITFESGTNTINVSKSGVYTITAMVPFEFASAVSGTYGFTRLRNYVTQAAIVDGSVLFVATTSATDKTKTSNIAITTYLTAGTRIGLYAFGSAAYTIAKNGEESNLYLSIVEH